MDILKDLAVVFFTLYLSFVHFLAAQLTHFFPAEPLAEEVALENTTPPSFTTLPSQVHDLIPDVLLRSQVYQQAAIIAAGDQTGATTHNPEEALVNIFCTTLGEDYIRTTTGSGFFIDPDGVIMTNAHVAQFLLLEQAENEQTSCVVRSGNPATPQYHAKLLYLPPSWIQNNATVIHDAVPMGTGERDYALLYVSARVDNEPLPATFPALGFRTDPLPITARGNTVVATGYPATDLLIHGADTDLIPHIATTSISELYTFGSNRADVFSIHGSVVGAEGASGGPVVDTNGDVIGLIVTRGDDAIDGVGSLRAITLSHIDRTITEETGFSLAQSLGGNLPYRASVFTDTLTPFLLTILETAR